MANLAFNVLRHVIKMFSIMRCLQPVTFGIEWREKTALFDNTGRETTRETGHPTKRFVLKKKRVNSVMLLKDNGEPRAREWQSSRIKSDQQSLPSKNSIRRTESLESANVSMPAAEQASNRPCTLKKLRLSPNAAVPHRIFPE